MTQRLLLLIFGVTMFTLITASKNDDAIILKSSGSHISSTGAPGEQSCAKAGCHVDAKIERDDNKVVTTLTLDNGRAIYTPATKYTVKLRAVKAGVKRFGFQVVALDTNNRTIGTFAVPKGSNLVQLQKGPVNNFDRNYVTHTTLGNKPKVTSEIEWLFNWTAPTNYMGRVTFYYCVNATNMDDENSGDNLFLASESFTAQATEIKENPSTSADFQVYPTVASDYLTIDNESGLERGTLYSIFSVSGILLLKDGIENGGNSVKIPLVSLPNGFYSIVITTQTSSVVKHFMVMR